MCLGSAVDRQPPSGTRSVPPNPDGTLWADNIAGAVAVKGDHPPDRAVKRAAEARTYPLPNTYEEDNMPIPTPRKDEKEKDFISRCVSMETKAAPNRDKEQIVAMCYSKWREKHGGKPPKKKSSVEFKEARA